MSNLFILGNGFDLAHGMPTGYNNFRKYLQDKYQIEDVDDPYDREPLEVPYFDPEYDTYCSAPSKYEESVVEFLFGVFDMNNPDQDQRWGNFEKSLSNMDYGVDYADPVLDRDGVENPFKTANVNEGIASQIASCIGYISFFFTNWINSINISKKENSRIRKLLKTDGYIFSFNYTETVEKLYHIDSDKICHIHGKVGEPLIFGHGDDEDYSEKYMGNNVGTENVFPDIDMMLRKDVLAAMDKNESFFSLIKDKIDRIYSFGFSYEDVDMPYIERFIDMFNAEGMFWLFDDYDREQTIRFENLIREQGYIGQFSTFKTK